MPFERVMGPNRHIMENYGDLQPIARSMKPTLWVPSENLPFGLLSKAEPSEDIIEHPTTSKLGESSEKPKGASEAFKSKDDYVDTNHFCRSKLC